jgi:hypothetical protein
MKMNFGIFFIAVIILGLLSGISFFAVWAEDEGQCGNLICQLFYYSIYFFSLPFTFLIRDFVDRDVNIYILSLFANALFWALLYERLYVAFHYLKNRRKI